MPWRRGGRAAGEDLGMAEESVLDRAGPGFIIAMLAVVMVVIVFLVIRGNGSWGEVSPERTVAASPAHGEGGEGQH